MELKLLDASPDTSNAIIHHVEKDQNGAKVGDGLGRPVGLKVGAVGSGDGYRVSVGSGDGSSVGAALGASDGARDGRSVGTGEGARVGAPYI